ncbi:TetR/AcrR family transcriptional regulator [Streptomyces sp. NPDC048304]|uniref:TetR/AcrR family transcriptional regulator n=1 Tax=Streptomyces sp. NPDC048304 TaxID=3154820 RepID=UPI0033BFFD69
MAERESVVPGRRERNKLRIRSRIYDSALELFTRQGYEQTTVDEITEAADVARGTFFNHFQRKEDVIAAWGETRRELLHGGLAAEGLRPDGEESTVHALLRCMSILADISLRDADQTRALLTAWVKAGFPLHEQPYVSDTFAAFVAAGQGRGEIRPSVDARLAGFLLRDVYLGTLFRWAQPNPGMDLEADLHAACTTVLEGILAGGTPAR